ncbi:hypothetical protein Acsp02_62230 [Actinoplanes sp. NBRC 103695]|nr:hypothetical protein Acsp02_62230 [Actinoplanes sp. NBRC 103695]
MLVVSFARSGRTIREGPSARALRTSARAVIDLEPGSRTEAVTGPSLCGAVHDVTRPILPGTRRGAAI